MAVAVRSSGHVERLGGGDPSLRQTTEIDVERPAFENVAARSLSLIVKSQGTALQHQADVDLRAQGLAFDGGSPSDDHVTLSATVDRDAPVAPVPARDRGARGHEPLGVAVVRPVAARPPLRDRGAPRGARAARAVRRKGARARRLRSVAARGRPLRPRGAPRRRRGGCARRDDHSSSRTPRAPPRSKGRRTFASLTSAGPRGTRRS